MGRVIPLGKYGRESNPCKHCRVRENSIFSGIDDSELSCLSDIVECQTVYGAGDILFHEGEALSSIYTLFEGWVLLYRELVSGKRQILHIALPGDFIGYQVDGNGGASVNAIALTNSILCSYPYNKLQNRVLSYPQIASRLYEVAIRDMNLCQQLLTITARTNAQARIAYLLLQIYYRVLASSGEYIKSSEHPTIQFPLTQEQIGDSLGLTSIHVNRVLRQFIQQGVINCSKRQLILLDITFLKQLSNFDESIIVIPSLLRN